jgi:hypothetical protein
LVDVSQGSFILPHPSLVTALEYAIIRISEV